MPIMSMGNIIIIILVSLIIFMSAFTSLCFRDHQLLIVIDLSIIVYNIAIETPLKENSHGDELV